MAVEKMGKIIWNKSGKGYLSPKVALCGSFIEQMGLDSDSRDITISYDLEKKEIVIRKSENSD